MTTNSTSINEININDVLCGRGGKINAYSGNVQFRKLVKLHKKAYLMVKKHEKVEIAQMVVNTIQSMDPPGRFLKEHEDSKSWVEIPNERVLKKTKQALREPEDDQTEDKGDAFQLVYPTIADSSVNYPPLELTQAPSKLLDFHPNVHQAVLEGRSYPPQEALFTDNTRHNDQLQVNSDATMGLRDSNQSCDTGNINNNAFHVSTSTVGMGNSSSSTMDTSSVSFSSSFNNNRRDYFRKMQSEASSLSSLFSSTDNAFNEDEIMKESLATIDMIPSKSIEVKSVDMQSFTTMLEDKVSLSTDFVAHVIPDDDDAEAIRNTVDMPPLQATLFS